MLKNNAPYTFANICVVIKSLILLGTFFMAAVFTKQTWMTFLGSALAMYRFNLVATMTTSNMLPTMLMEPRNPYVHTIIRFTNVTLGLKA